MNGKLAINIDEEALFEVLVAANFAAPAGRAAVKVPAGVIESIAEPSWISQGFPTHEIKVQRA
jgi:hypothetical protein